jgi:DNA primase
LPVSDVCGKRVKLQKRGREFVGLSPFNNEKSPSFTVNDQKGFYHCFSSGKHGDVFSFVMATEGLSFPEAVEKLARQVGMEVPQETPQERARTEKRAGLHDVMEAACKVFERSLDEPGGKAARSYLEGRGLDNDTIRGFRLGYAPQGNAMRVALEGNGITEALLLEGGLLRRPDDGRAAYPFFRDRVIFPITDRRGRVIGFGGRMMGDGNAAKYINSPDTPLFDKGRTLYNLADARQAAHDGHEVIVAEGYMDVIALVSAGFKGAVAPLGTALTETQLGELWRLAPEPILCFDGDAAGGRAAMRAAERALALLKPGHSMQFAHLPSGDDPDSLIAGQGAGAMKEIITNARPLVDVIWTYEQMRKPVDTPERRADLEARLQQCVSQIADRGVQEHYRQAFRDRVWQSFRGRGSGRGAGRGGGRDGAWRGGQSGGQGSGKGGGRRFGSMESGAQGSLTANVSAMRKRRQQVVLAVILNYPALLEEFGESLAQLTLVPELDKLRQEIHHWHANSQGLDAEDLKRHLSDNGFGKQLDTLASKEVLSHAAFARELSENGALESDLLLRAREGLQQTLRLLAQVRRKEEILAQGRAAAGEGTEESEQRFFASRRVMEEETAEMLGDEENDLDFGRES